MIRHRLRRRFSEENEAIAKLNELEWNLSDKGFSDPMELFWRAVKTIETLGKEEKDKEKVFNTMKKISENSVKPLPEDVDTLFDYYENAAKLSDSDVLYYLADCDRISSRAVSDELTELLFSKIPEDAKTILIPNGDKLSRKLYEFAKNRANTKFVIFSTEKYVNENMEESEVPNDRKNDILKFAFKDFSNVEIREKADNEKFECIVLLPVKIKSRIINRSIDKDRDIVQATERRSLRASILEEISKRDAELENTVKYLESLENNGELISVLYPRSIYAERGVSAGYRKNIWENYKIKRIDALPDGCLRRTWSMTSGTVTRGAYILTAGLGTTEKVAAQKYIFDTESYKVSRLDENNEEISDEYLRDILVPCREEKTISREDFENLKGWQVDSVLNSDDALMKAYNDSKYEKKKLSEIGTIYRGKAYNPKAEEGKEEDEKPIRVISIKSIGDYSINYDMADRISDFSNSQNYRLENGDVLITIKGTGMKVAVFTQPENEPDTIFIPSVNLCYIRPDKEKMDSFYLKSFLESPVGMHFLEKIKKGNVLISINTKDLENVEVPVPTLNEQRNITEDYQMAVSGYLRALKDVQQAKKDINDKLY